MTLEELQRRVGAAIMAPLARHDEISTEWQGEADALIKPNDRLAPLERLEIYSRSYWFRILGSLYEDFPGLRAVIGERSFRQLWRAYLTERPSRSFTLRDLGSRLPEWLARNPRYAGKPHALAIDMAALEFAHIEAFDSAAEKALGPEDLLALGPDFHARLQPYIRLLDLTYPVDDLRIPVSAPDVGRTSPLRLPGQQSASMASRNGPKRCAFPKVS